MTRDDLPHECVAVPGCGVDGCPDCEHVCEVCGLTI